MLVVLALPFLIPGEYRISLYDDNYHPFHVIDLLPMWSTLLVFGLLGPLEAGRLVISTAFGVSHAHVLRCLVLHNFVLH